MEEKDNISQARIAQAGGISVVTLRKRVLDISELFLEIHKSKLGDRWSLCITKKESMQYLVLASYNVLRLFTYYLVY